MKLSIIATLYFCTIPVFSIETKTLSNRAA